MAYLVDTDILVDFHRGSLDALDYLAGLGDWSYSVVTAMELFAGARDKREVRNLERFLSAYREIPLSEEIGSAGRELVKHYAESHGLDPDDALIAATAIHEGLTLATRNRKHFSAIGGLEVEVPAYR